MNKKTLLMSLGAVLLVIVAFIIYNALNYRIILNVTSNSINVNLYDSINVRDYLLSAKDNWGNSLYDEVKINVEYDDQDVLTDDNLYIGGTGSKVINYIVQKKGVIASKSIIISVIINPDDKNFNPNYENMQNGINNYDTGDGDRTDNNLTESQIEYLNKYRNK